MVLLGQDSNLYGELRMIHMQQQYFAADFPKQCSLKQMSKACQMTLFDLSQSPILSAGVRLAPIFRQLGIEQDLLDFVAVFSLSSCDFFNSSSLKFFSLRMSRVFLAAAPTRSQNTQLELFSVTKPEDGAFPRRHVLQRSQLRNSIRARISSEYSGSLGKWGMTAHGSSATDIAGCHKTAPEFSLLVVTGNIQCRRIEPDRPTLQECLDTDGLAINSVNGKPIVESLTLKANSHKAGTGNSKHPVAVVGSLNEKAESKLAVMYRSATGDRLYTEESPTLRSLANTGGKHQGGGGAWKVVEYKGEDYLVSTQFPEEACSLASTCSHLRSGARPRKLKDGLAALIPISYRRHRPLSATEFERLMGWPVGCTEKGITRDGKEITISKTQRQKMLGNGIIPHEIEDICHKLKPILAFPSPDSQPEPRSPEEESPSDLNSGKPKNLDGINSPRSSLAGCVL